ncbi:cupin [Nocardioides sp. Root190]|uniref:cupin domain-containing protein n=1 Tax=Nocardioides sp. Root190 TaxID=1736488 RepID=UPI0006F85752|nr:cupin domain-containing protein [Nocardioides sp. Root190]KRB75795.1 cupin [Nocardioides sp. Root190]
MSYPPPLYDGDGEVSAWVRPGDAEPDLVYPNGNRVHHLARGESTGGQFGLYRWEFSEAVSGPGLHFHRSISESFYILDGEVRIHDGTEWVTARPGDFLHVPAGGLHGFRNESGAPASMLLHFSPGAPREAYFEGLDRLARGEQWTSEQYDEFMREHDNVWVEE